MAAATTPAVGCGFEDPNSVSFARGILNFAYPNSLHVTSAVGGAQLDGLIPRLQSSNPTETLLSYHKAAARLSAVHGRLSASMDAREMPPVSIVLIGPMLWTRFVPDGAKLDMVVHSKGPEPGDVVVVTDAPVVIALTEKRINVSSAIDLGLLKFYGAPESVATAKAWFLRWPH